MQGRRRLTAAEGELAQQLSRRAGEVSYTPLHRHALQVPSVALHIEENYTLIHAYRLAVKTFETSYEGKKLFGRMLLSKEKLKGLGLQEAYLVEEMLSGTEVKEMADGRCPHDEILGSVD